MAPSQGTKLLQLGDQAIHVLDLASALSRRGFYNRQHTHSPI